jgi:hypothetical protein
LRSYRVRRDPLPVIEPNIQRLLGWASQDHSYIDDPETDVLARSNHMGQQGDLSNAEADAPERIHWVEYGPSVQVNEGVGRIVAWYVDYRSGRGERRDA